VVAFAATGESLPVSHLLPMTTHVDMDPTFIPLADLAAASQQVAAIADGADRLSHALWQATGRCPALGGVDTQMLGLLLSELAGRLEHLSTLTRQFAQHCASAPAVENAAAALTEAV
jgi:hypothetical protein